MTFDDHEIDTLRAWARHHAPHEGYLLDDVTPVPRRRVRLEIAAELCEHYSNDYSHEIVMCRAYLAEPRCADSGLHAYGCECGPLAEQRLG